MNSEIHLFIIWEKGRSSQKKILDDIASHFSIIKQYEITWTPSLAASNFTRFCGTRLGRNLQYKIDQSGTGEFFVVVVCDESPIYEERKTFHGTCSVNVKMFDAKQRYREWSGGGIRVHATDNAIETDHDLTLLIGKNVKDFLATCTNSRVEKLHRDLEGAHGWESIQQLFYVLNNTVRYAVMRGYGELTTGDFIDHGDTDLMTDDYENLWIIVNAPKLYPNTLKPKAKIQVRDNTYILDIWNCGWNGCMYFDPRWSKEMLDNAMDWHGIRILAPQNDFYCLLYHCLTNKGFIADDYLSKLLRYRQEFGLTEMNWNKILVSFLQDNRYEVIRPKDTSVTFNLSNPDISQYALRHGICVDMEWQENCVVTCFKKEGTVVKKGSNSIISAERRVLEKVGDGVSFQKLIDYGIDGDEVWIELSAIEGICLNDYLSNRKNLKINVIRGLWLSILAVLEQLQREGIEHGSITGRDIFVAENGKSVAIANFSKAHSVELGKESNTDWLCVAKIFKDRFGSVDYVRRVSGALNLTEARELLNVPVDLKSRYSFCKRRYAFIKSYIKHPKLIMVKCAVVVKNAVNKAKNIMRRI